MIPNWRSLPKSIKTLLVLSEILFLIVSVSILGMLSQTYANLKRELSGAQEAQEMVDTVVELGIYRGACSAEILFSSIVSDISDICIEASSLVTGSRWKEAKPSNAQDNPSDFFEGVSRDVKEELQSLESLYSHSRLKLDDREETYTLGRLGLIGLPRMIESLGQLRGSHALNISGHLSESEFRRIQGQLDIVSSDIESLLTGLVKSNSSFDELLFTYRQIHEETDAYQTELDKSLLGETDDVLAIQVEQQFQQGTLLVKELKRLNDSVLSSLASMLQSLIQQHFIVLMLSCIAAIATQLIIVLFSRNLANSYFQRSRLAQEAVAASAARLEIEQRENERFRKLTRTLSSIERVAGIGSWELDLIDNKVIWSDQTRRIHEMSDDYEPILDEGINFYEEGESRQKITESVQKAVETGEGWDLELAVITGKGNRIWVRSRGTAEYSDGKCVRLFGVFQDITERFRNEQALLTSKHETEQLNQELEWKERVFNATQKIANIGSFNTNIKTDEQWYSDQLKAIFGYSPSEEFNRDLWINHVYPNDVERVIQTTTEIFEKKISTTSYLNYRIVTRDDQLKWVDVSWTFNFDEQGEIAFIEGSVQDVTDKQLAMAHQEAISEELRVANTRAESASAMKSEFLANMSHEIRTPMNAVLGLAQVLTKEKEYPASVVAHAQKIVRAGQSLQNLLNDILDFSKIESGKLTLSLMPMRLSEIQENLAVLMGSAARDKQIELIIEPLPQSDQALLGDQLRLEQVLINLVGNAIKFTESGYVAFKVARLDVPDQVTATTLKFSVTDSGIGMTPEQMQRILEPFSQADASITRRFGGTGLGLTISQRLLRLMDSELVIESEIGKGAEFTFTLTLENAETLSAEDLLSESSLGVLVVDDHDIAREAICRTADSLGWQTIAASGGHQALEIYKEKLTRGEDLGVILMDWMMPDLDGISVAKQIKEIAKEQGADHTPTVIMVTAYSQSQVERSPDIGCVDLIINKPITAAGLRKAYATLTGEYVSSFNDSVQTGSMLTGKTLLVVDDNLFNRDVAKTIFEGEGATVVLAEDGQQAVNWLEREDNVADAVLMDVQMPVLDGLEATRVIREQNRFDTLPIIGMSAGAYKSDIDNALSAGMNAYITKPINIQSALHTLAEQLGIDPVSLSQSSQADVSEPHKELTIETAPLFDEDSALDFWKDEQKLASYLKLFISDFNEALIAGDTFAENVSTTVLHKLKGSSGTIYLARLRLVLGEAEVALNANEGLENKLLELAEVWEQTLPLITAFIDLHNPATETTDSVNPDSSLTLRSAELQELLESIESYNPDEVNAVLEPLMSAHSSTILRDIQEAIAIFDFAKATSLAKSILSE